MSFEVAYWHLADMDSATSTPPQLGVKQTFLATVQLMPVYEYKLDHSISALRRLAASTGLTPVIPPGFAEGSQHRRTETRHSAGRCGSGALRCRLLDGIDWLYHFNLGRRFWLGGDHLERNSLPVLFDANGCHSSAEDASS